MTEQELRARVDAVIALAGDDERAHACEDDLHLEVIAAFCPDWVVAEVKRLSDASFMRWCA